MDDLLKSKEQLVEELQALREQVKASRASTVAGTAERARIEEVLQATLHQVEVAKQEWEATIDSLSDLVCLLNHRGHILRANRTVERWGLGSVTDIQGQQIQQLFLSGKNDFWEHSWIALAQGQPVDKELKDDRLNRHLHIQIEPIQTQTTWHDQLRTSYAAVVIRDITERVHTQARLLKSNQRLAETLGQLQETQEQLIQQERLAAVGQLAAGIAHDFNNLLTSIIGFAGLLQVRPTLPLVQRQKNLASIVDQGQQAAHLVRQILDFSRKSIRQPRPLDLVPFLRESIKFLERTIPENIRIILNTELVECLISADSTQLQQVLTNLAINARDAMPTGGELKLQLSCLTLKSNTAPLLPNIPPGKWAVLSVSDTGVGISNKALPHIFEPFYTTKEVGHGSGLGLAQVYGIIKQHDGYITVASQSAQGATFTIYLPAQKTKTALPPVETTTTADFSPGRGETILLVEDEPTVLDICRAMLQELNYQVITAINGQKALAVYEANKDKIDLILTDVVMPDMDGLTLAKILKMQNPQVNIVVMSGYPLDKTAQKDLGQGGVGWLAKPLIFDQLARSMRQALSR